LWRITKGFPLVEEYKGIPFVEDYELISFEGSPGSEPGDKRKKKNRKSLNI
jgi:hypothetical protein